MEQKIWKHFQNVRAKSPLVHNITNYVVMNNTANALLAVGASPVMAHSVEEVEDMVRIANALVINIGTLSPRWIDAMILAIREANRQNKPIVFDPVGAGATDFRNRTIQELLGIGKFSVIRANASELMAMESSENRTKGVDSSNTLEQAYSSAKYLSGKYSNVVCMSGKTDVIISGKLRMKIHNGHEMMSRVTGLGCTATAVIGAFIGTVEDTFEATISAMAVMGVAGELAAKTSAGPGSLQLNLLDKLYNMTEQEFLQTVKLENNA
jgi:hydroxyethylthiazole kinase